MNYVNRKNKKEIYIKLFNEQKGRCFVCGRKDISLELHHLIPISIGGINDLNNMILVCPECHRSFEIRPFREIEFNFFLSTLLDNNENFRNINRESLLSEEIKFRADILAEEKIDGKWRKVLIELKSFSTFTSVKVKNILNQLNVYRNAIGEDVKIVLAFPGILPKSDYEIFKKNNIEIWDRKIISKKFKKEIAKFDNKLFLKYFTVLPQRKKIPKEKKLITDLKSIKPGKKVWYKYQKHIENILDYLFGDTLSSPITELPDQHEINRRDFILRNYSEKSFWKFLRERYCADFIVIDAKNYTGKVKKNQILQIANYLKLHGTGLFGLIISRNGEDKSSFYTRREKWILENKLIIILDDSDIEKMILSKTSNDNPEEIIKQRIEEFRLKI